MSRTLAVWVGLIAVILAAAVSPSPSGTAAAQSASGRVTGQVTDAQGQPLAGITVAAAPVASPDAVTLTATDPGGRYALDLPPGDYDVAFNTLAPINDNYDSVTFGGPGPAAGAVCTVCGGRAVTVAAGGETPGIGAALASPPFPQKGFVRPLSGKVIRVVGGRVGFLIGCHVEPTGCLGTARLRFGRSVAASPVAAIGVLVLPGQVGKLSFKLPAAALARLLRAPHRALAALVEVTAPPSHVITRFTLVDR